MLGLMKSPNTGESRPDPELEKDRLSNPFCVPCQYMPSGYACAPTVADQLFVIKTFDERELRQVLALEDIRETVRRAAENRLRRLLRAKR